MSNPAVRARRAAATQNPCNSRISSFDISVGTVSGSASLAIWETPRGTQRDSMQGACGPPLPKTTAASAPKEWTASHIRARLRTSQSSQRRAETRWLSSDSGWIEQYSVEIAPQPPSAFMPRWPAWKPGFSEPAPEHCGVQ